MKKFEPVHGVLLVKRDNPEEISKGGIILTNQPIQPFGVIKEVGSYSDFEVEKRIMFKSYLTTITLNEEEFVIVEEKDVLGVLTNEE